MDLFALPSVRRIVDLAIGEDIGRGDLTSAATVPAGTAGTAALVSRQAAVVAGTPLIRMVFEALGGEVDVRLAVSDGDRVTAGSGLCELRGPARTLLAGERVGLNFLQQLSGVATLTRCFVDAVAGTGVRIADTRKTVAGLRVLHKYAVRVGGGTNHRFGLDDGILIKDNHIAAAGGVAVAVERARRAAPHGWRVEVECDSLAEVDEALAAGAEVVMLDNMPVEALRAAVERARGRAIIEASGGVTLENVREIAEAGVDVISIGCLTHSAPAVDIGMDWLLVGGAL